MFKPKLSRRKFLWLTGLAAGGVYVQQRGLRYPRLSFEHRAVAREVTLANSTLSMQQMILVRSQTQDSTPTFRAIAPEPVLRLNAHSNGTTSLNVNNIAANARLEVSGDSASQVHESIDGITRRIDLQLAPEQSIELQWRLPEQDGLTFAVIGDTGADLELQWVLQRCAQLGVQFLLHLGDFNYVEGEYDRAIELFNSAPLPCYVSIGNHDFNDSGLVYQQFLEQIGPMNHAFTIAGARFVNLDSAADFFPASSGQRGELFKRLAVDTANYHDQVYFTHRPFKDPRPGKDHVIGGINEINWLHGQIQGLGGHTLLTGHVHKSAEMDVEGIRQLVAGEGMAHDDIVAQKKVSSILLGSLEKGQKINYQWRDLNMPWASLVSPTHEMKLKLEQSPEKLQWYRKMISQHGVSI